MDVIAIAASTVATLTPFFLKGAEAIASELGKKTLGGAERVLGALLARWCDKPDPAEKLAAFAKAPAEGREALTLALVAELAADPQFAGALQALLRDDAPQLRVEQSAVNVRQLTGAEVEQMIRGLLAVTQDVRDADTVVGAKIGRLG